MPEKQILKILGSQFTKQKKNQDTKVVNGGWGEPLVGQQKRSDSKDQDAVYRVNSGVRRRVERCP